MLYRKPKFKDVETIHKLINHYADQGLMLPRSRNILYETLRDMIVAEQHGAVVGVGALHLVWDELAEIRAMAIAPEAAKQGVGRSIVEALVLEARELGVKTLFTLTYQPGFFAKLGFAEVGKEALPHKVWKECINCPKFPNCDETAMIRTI
ncbi:N-acetyltransferase|uniref:Amino-acid N-acetyltransferase n=1 Tax=Dendrosporobacter quercicolus TaxID=146817 RepID=A0A1G9RPF3_9FIRM|nr:N-acetyltransferase [Dendrosporobacter quercicolus]NSL49387.1 N-acetyltransferase [Dendrosporobacter quercicolus DSM 1736]SDM25064.1 amino-acid N-acetyltransferase [Dendrosporobacter quercicolus]